MDYRQRQRLARLKDICGKHVYPWFVEIGKLAKRHGVYPVSFCDYYTSKQDKEIAAIIELLMPEKNRITSLIELRNLLGNDLWSMVEERSFLQFNRQGKLKCGISYYDITHAFDWIWFVCVSERIPMEYVIMGELGIIKKRPETDITVSIERNNLNERLYLMLAKMVMKDGWGAGLWNFLKEKNLHVHTTLEMRKVLRALFPIENGLKIMPTDDILRYMGFEKPIDFLYSYWAYRHIEERESQTVKSLEKRIKQWYESFSPRGAMAIKSSPIEIFEQLGYK